MQAQIDKLVELDKKRREAWNKVVIEQERVKGTFDKRSRHLKFNVGDVAAFHKPRGAWRKYSSHLVCPWGKVSSQGYHLVLDSSIQANS